MRKRIFPLILVSIVLASCTTTKVMKSERYPHMYEEQPVSILLMPPINRSTKVEAKELFYSSLVVPLTLRGYYVMPPLLTMEILKEESAYDAEMFIESSMKQVGTLFGVDAVLFTTIHEWNKTAIASQVRVVVEYTLKSAKTDEILFNRKGDIVYSPNVSTGNLLGNIIANAVATAFTKEIEMGRKCNIYTLNDMPAGKYDPSAGTDGKTLSGEPSFSIKLQ